MCLLLILPRSEPALGKKIEGESNVDDAPGLVNAILDHQRRNDGDVFLDSQADEVLEGFAEIQRNPLQTRVDVPDSLCDLGEGFLGSCPLQQFPWLFAAPFRVDDSVGWQAPGWLAHGCGLTSRPREAKNCSGDSPPFSWSSRKSRSRSSGGGSSARIC